MANKPQGFLLGAGARSVPIPICDDSLTTMGRDEENTIALDDLAASRRHAYIECRGGAIYITDLDSSNGTFIDENPLNPHEKTQLKSGQELRIGGKVFFVISADSPMETQKVTLSRAEAVSKKVTIGAGYSLKALKEAHRQKQLKTPSPPKAPKLDAATTPLSQTFPADFKRPSSKQDATRKSPVSPLASPVVSAPASPPANAPALARAEEHTLSGAINNGGLPQIIQMINTKKFSGIMKVTGTKFPVTILFVNGELHAAFAGKKRGAEAVISVAMETDTAFTFNRLEVSAVETTPRNITTGTIQILMECCCKIHEAAQQG